MMIQKCAFGGWGANKVVEMGDLVGGMARSNYQTNVSLFARKALYRPLPNFVPLN